MTKIAIVAIGYNRPKCLLRLLNSLEKANYNGDDVTLIISIDKSGNNDVENIANNFKWSHGDKVIKTYKKRMGLRNHIICCGELTEEYDNIIMFEDDIYASEGYYNFAKQTIEKYKDDDRIAGISLYNHSWNINCNRPFEPIIDSYDIYFLQIAQSWGQIWTKNQWRNFIRWYEKNKNSNISGNDIPQNISSWPESSWLKFYIKYIVKTNRYFVYPKESLTTNFGDIGEHAKDKNNDYQVSIQNDSNKKYNLPNFDQVKRKYDVFFESTDLSNTLNIEKNDLLINLYGVKEINKEKRYLLTMEKFNYKIIKSFGLNLRPHDINVENNIEGNDIFLYDTYVKNKNNIKSVSLKKAKYDIKGLSTSVLIQIILYRIKQKLIKNILKGRR